MVDLSEGNVWMSIVAQACTIVRDHEIATWFRCGGRAKLFAAPTSVEQVCGLVKEHAGLLVLGDGANLLVADGGVDELVVCLNQGEFGKFSIDADAGTVWCGAGVDLKKLINETVRAGLGGLETLAGIPASIGGACVMNAGGTFGQFGDYVKRVMAVRRSDGAMLELDKEQMKFAYRKTWFDGMEAKELIVTHVLLGLEPKREAGDTEKLRARQLEVMAYKKRTQPMAANSAGCCFKNPTLVKDLSGIAQAGARVSAGMLIDKVGCKGLKVGGAKVSEQHGNFIVAEDGCTASDILALMRLVRQRVEQAFDVRLANEVVIWGEEF